jgi:hypothetical protein
MRRLGGSRHGLATSTSKQSRRWRIKIGFEACLGSIKWISSVTAVSLASSGACHFLVKVKYRAKRSLEVIHGDLCRSITPTMSSGKKVFLLLIDNYTRFMWVALL